MTRTLPRSVRPVLAFLIPLLGSDKDGEALGAARAISRKLHAAGLDLHDLAAVVAGTAPAVVDISPVTPAEPRPRSKRSMDWRPPEYVHLAPDQRIVFGARLADALADPSLKGWPRSTISKLVDRLDRHPMPPTRRMVERAEEIMAGLDGGAA